MQNADALLDDVGWKILAILQAEARISYKDLGERIGMTGVAVAERVKRLEEAGVIKGYRAQIDFEKVGLPITAYIKLDPRVAKSDCTAIIEMVNGMPEVVEYIKMVGYECMVFKVLTSSIKHLEAVMSRFMPHGSFSTSIVLSTPIEHKVVERQLLTPLAEGLS